ncbi:hypothetical protein AMEJIAPC_01642 [Caulobacter sp. NIBR1757]|nr:hypothetical protein AMEJIAPC_01642 [Caulobacter sp. NIBR1757]
MFSVSFSWGQIAGMGVALGLGLLPIVLATVLSWRSLRRGWWLVGPGGLFIVSWPLTVLVVSATGGMKSADGPAFGIAATTIIAAWVSLGLFLTALAIAGPKLPTLDVGKVF